MCVGVKNLIARVIFALTVLHWIFKMHPFGNGSQTLGCTRIVEEVIKNNNLEALSPQNLIISVWLRTQETAFFFFKAHQVLYGPHLF